MSRRIAKLLDESEAELSKLLADLEKKNGLPSHDARHIADVHQRVRSKLADLNLDPNDTTAPELYHTLLIRFDTDCRKFDEVYGAAAADFDHKAAATAKMLENSGRLPRLWALKNKSAKELLSVHAPKQVMKFLGYRSTASLLKREDISEIFIAAQILESDSWQKQQVRLVSKLQPTAFELREIRLVTLRCDRWAELDYEDAVIASDDMGAVAIWPSEQAAQAPLLSISLLLIEELRKYDGRQLAAADIFTKDKTLAWWSDMDHLVADLRGGQVSMNLHDVAGDWLGSQAFENRSLQKGRHNYWRQLIDKYEHKGDIEALFDDTVMRKVQQLKFSVPQPAFEYDFAEDL